MTAKEYLRQIGVLDAKINRRLKQVEELKELATATGSLAPGDRVQSSPAGDRMSSTVIKWIDMEHEVTRMIDELVDLKNQVIGEIHQLDDQRYIRILEMRYIDQEKWEQIALNMHLDVRWVYRLHGYALQEFAQRNLVK